MAATARLARLSLIDGLTPHRAISDATFGTRFAHLKPTRAEPPRRRHENDVYHQRGSSSANGGGRRQAGALKLSVRQVVYARERASDPSPLGPALAGPRLERSSRDDVRETSATGPEPWSVSPRLRAGQRRAAAWHAPPRRPSPSTSAPSPARTGATGRPPTPAWPRPRGSRCRRWRRRTPEAARAQ